MLPKIGRLSLAAALVGLVSATGAFAEAFDHNLVFESESHFAIIDDFDEHIFDHELYNTGDQADTYELTIKKEYFSSSDLDWGWSLCTSTQCVLDSTTTTIAAGSSDSVSVHINVEPGAVGGTRTTLKVKSVGDPSDVTIAQYTVIHTSTGILIVDDDCGADYELCVLDAFEALGEPYGVLSGRVAGTGSSLADSITGPEGPVEKICWLTGDLSEDTITASDQEVLAGFLDAGGKLLVSGQDVLNDISGTAFATTYLGAHRLANATSTNVSGVSGDPVGNGRSFSLVGGCGNNQVSHDAIAPVPGQVIALKYDGSGQTAGVRKRGYGDWKTVTLAFGLEGIASESERQNLVQQIFNWFDAGEPYSHQLVFEGTAKIARVPEFEEYVFDFELYNTGTQDDTYKLKVTKEYFASTSDDWGWALCTSDQCVEDSTTTSISAGNSDSVSVHVSALPTAAGGTRVTLSVQSLNASDNATVQNLLAIHDGTQVLFIDDDGGASYEDCVLGAMEASGRTYGVWETYVQELTAQDLEPWNTEIVAMCFGDARTNTITASDQAILASYLDDGGDLLVSGQDLLDDIGATAFAAQYLAAARLANATSTNVVGVAGDPVGNGRSFSLVGGCAPNQNSHDAILPVPGQMASLRYVGTGEVAGVRRQGQGYKTVTLAFGLEGISSNSERNALVDHAFDWFEAAPLAVVGAGDLALLRGAAFPNPFRSSGHMLIVVPDGLRDDVRIDLFDASGRLVSQVFEGRLATGRHEIDFDGRDSTGRILAPGVYFYRIGAGEAEFGGKLTIVR